MTAHFPDFDGNSNDCTIQMILNTLTFYRNSTMDR